MEKKWKNKVIPEPFLQFKRELEASHPEPRYGLRNYGPLDFNTGRRPLDFQLKIGLICKESDQDRILRFFNGLNREWDPRMKGSKVKYAGFENIYKSELELPEKHEILTFSIHEIKSLLKSDLPFESILHMYRQKIEEFKDIYRGDSVLAIQVPKDFSQYFIYGWKDLRNEIKGICVTKGIKSQLLTERALGSKFLCDNYWNLSLGLYVKAGGVPWKIKGEENYNCYIGVSFGIKKSKEKQDILIGLAEVFDEFGEHVTIETIECAADKNEFFYSKGGYHVRQKKVEELLKLALEGYKNKRERYPEIMTIHKTSSFEENEKHGFLNVLGDKCNLINVVNRTDLKLIPETGGFPPTRGSYWKIDKQNCLIYTTGVVDISEHNRNIFDKTYPGIGTSRPLELNINHNADDLETIASDLFKLTKMNLNSSRLMNREPITIELSRKVADILKTGVKPERILKDFRYYI